VRIHLWSPAIRKLRSKVAAVKDRDTTRRESNNPSLRSYCMCTPTAIAAHGSMYRLHSYLLLTMRSEVCKFCCDVHDDWAIFLILSAAG
jgi:hypothetical protein